MGNLVPDELRIQIRDTVLLVFRTLFNPMTSTQLGILERVLQVKKQNTLGVTSRRAQEFQEKFLDMFKEKRAEDIATFHRRLTARDEEDERNPPGDDLETLIERHYENRAIKTKTVAPFNGFPRPCTTKALIPSERRHTDATTRGVC